MFRISRLTDYGTVILVYLAEQGGRLCPANEVAAGTHVAAPTVQKLLKVLARAGLVESFRGADGGYRLSRSPRQINAAQVTTLEIDAQDGDNTIELLDTTGDTSVTAGQHNDTVLLSHFEHVTVHTNAGDDNPSHLMLTLS